MQRLLLILACASALLTPMSVLAEGQLDATMRWTHTRWYEYPGNTFEEDFTLLGLRYTKAHLINESDVMGLSWGYGASLYPSLRYKGYRSVLETTGGAFGLGLEAFLRGAYDVANAVSIRAEARTEFSILLGTGTDDNVVPYGELFAHFLPMLSVGLGVELPDVRFAQADGMVIMVRTAILVLGTWTGNYIRNDPSLSTWSDMGVEVGFRF